ncbi:hypothetical protein GW17_00016024 [Ensete ventricosum]|nr:hypothetical protein GW17_00016024 [Ensete ventricosum]
MHPLRFPNRYGSTTVEVATDTDREQGRRGRAGGQRQQGHATTTRCWIWQRRLEEGGLERATTAVGVREKAKKTVMSVEEQPTMATVEGVAACVAVRRWGRGLAAMAEE